MASDASFVDYVCDQISGAGPVSSRKMFGEYAIYCCGKVVALVCDNQLFVKPTVAGRELIGKPVESPPYPGAKAYFLITDQLEDRPWITQLIRLTELETRAPKPKTAKKVKPTPASKRQ
jgi:TfoX/Sxy family transcriptional regulator of competence genes